MHYPFIDTIRNLQTLFNIFCFFFVSFVHSSVLPIKHFRHDDKGPYLNLFRQHPRIILTSIPWRAHVHPLNALGIALKKRGFQVYFALPSQYRSWVHPELRFSDLGEIEFSDRFPENRTHSGLEELLETLLSYHELLYGPLLKKLTSLAPQLIICDRWTLAGASTARRLNISYVINSPHLLLDYHSPGFEEQSAWQAHFRKFVSEKYGFVDRFLTEQTVYESLFNMWCRFRNRVDTLVWEERFQDQISDLEEANKLKWKRLNRHNDKIVRIEPDKESGFMNLHWYENAPHSTTLLDEVNWEAFESLPSHARPFTLSNSIFPFEPWKEVSPDIQFVGPLIVGADHRYHNIDSGLIVWLEQSLKPVIFVYLGQTSIERAHIVHIIAGLLPLETRILWCLPSEMREELLLVFQNDYGGILPPTFRLMDEMSHDSVLACLESPRVVGALVHGGVTIIQELLYFAKPVIVLPYFTDQWEIANRVQELCVGLYFDADQITGQIIEEAARFAIFDEVSEDYSFDLHPFCVNSSILDRVTELSRVLQRSPGVENAAHIVRGCFNLSLYESMSMFWEKFRDDKDSVIAPVNFVSQFLGILSKKNHFCHHLHAYPQGFVVENAIDVYLVLLLALSLLLFTCKCVVVFFGSSSSLG